LIFRHAARRPGRYTEVVNSTFKKTSKNYPKERANKTCIVRLSLVRACSGVFSGLSPVILRPGVFEHDARQPFVGWIIF